MLDSALNSPFQTFDNKDLYSSIESKAARLGYGLIKNHPFIDGNKRTGVHIMLVFLALNGVELEYTQKELYEIIMKVASGECDFQDLLEWVYIKSSK